MRKADRLGGCVFIAVCTHVESSSVGAKLINGDSAAKRCLDEDVAARKYGAVRETLP